MSRRKLIVILGPTASGKTRLAVGLAYKFQGEIISADSRQVYKGMNWGTGKDLREYKIKKGKKKIIIPHHLIDIVSPKTQFSLAQYQKLAYQKIKEIQKGKKIPFLVGGTGLYLDAITEGYIIPKAKPSKTIRKKLAKLSLKQLLTKLKKVDYRTYKTIDKKNRRRVERALEIYFQSQKPKSQQLKKSKPNFQILKIGLTFPKEELTQRIYKRLKQRLRKGMMAEVKNLHHRGLSWKRLEEFGLEYRWIAYYLQKKIDYKTMVEKLNQAIKNFAKRQMTWFRRDKSIHWIKNKKEAEKFITSFLKN